MLDLFAFVTAEFLPHLLQAVPAMLTHGGCHAVAQAGLRSLIIEKPIQCLII